MSLADLAAKLNLSPYYFQRLFKQEMNESPSAYINRVRLERAGHLLKAGTDYSMAQIAEDCGFSSAAVFNRSFKHRFKVSPLVFKQTPIPSIALMLKMEEIETAKADIVYLPDTYIYAIPASIKDENLLEEVEKASAICKQKNITVTGKKMGIITHNTFHYPHAKHNYHVGVTIDSKTAEPFMDKLFVITAGKYACFITTEPFSKTREVLTAFKIGWLDKSPYTWRELICYEEFLPGNNNEGQNFLQRKIYVPVKRR
jgi:AraC-like DNA-binding protein/DNA gyrase inhibitor GyrI